MPLFFTWGLFTSPKVYFPYPIAPWGPWSLSRVTKTKQKHKHRAKPASFSCLHIIIIIYIYIHHEYPCLRFPFVNWEIQAAPVQLFNSTWWRACFAWKGVQVKAWLLLFTKGKRVVVYSRSIEKSEAFIDLYLFLLLHHPLNHESWCGWKTP